MHHRLSTLPQREDADTRRAAEQPEDADCDPTSEEGPAEDVSRPEQRHRPEDKEGQRHGNGGGAGDDGGFLQLALLGRISFGVGTAPVSSWCEFQIDVGGGGDVTVVADTDSGHGDPVVVLATERVGQDGNEDKRTQEGGHVTGQHGVVATGALNVKHATCILSGHEPGRQGDNEPEDGGKGSGDPVLAFPQQGQGRRQHRRGD